MSPAGAADSGGWAPDRRAGQVNNLTWYELADALWLVGVTGAFDAPARRPDQKPEPPEPASEPSAGTNRPADEQRTPQPPPPEPTPTGQTRTTRQRIGRMPAFGGLGGTPLPAAGALARGLRPLRQRVPSPRLEVLDEEATAERAAHDPRWLPVLAPDQERRWDVVVVADDNLSMAVWQETVAALVDLLRRQGAFSDVSVRLLDTDRPDPAAVALRTSDGGRTVRPAELLTANRRRIILVVTDGAGPAWASGAVAPLLRSWASELPVAMVHLLPHEQWYRSGIRPQRMRLRSFVAGAANARIAWRSRDPLAGWDPGWGRTAIPVPVLELGPRWFAAWARLVTATWPRWMNLPAILVGADPAKPAPVAAEPRRGMDPRQLVREFMSWATPHARALATRLAAVPLNLPVMRVVQRDLPGSETAHLAEILNSGLIHPTVAPEQVRDPRRITFEFQSGVREELLAVARRTDTAQVVRLVDEQLGHHLPAVHGWSRVLDAPDAAPEPPPGPDLEPAIRIQQTTLQALSGRYLARARVLRRRLGRKAEPEPAPITPADQVSITSTYFHSQNRGTIAGVPDNDVTQGGTRVSATHGERAAPPAPARHSPRNAPEIWGNIPPRNPNFTGREELLAKLHEQMGLGPTAVLPQALHGMGGVGKSNLAAEYVYRQQHEYDLIWWISAERQTQIGAAMVELAQRMKLSTGLDVSTAIRMVKEALRLGEPFRNWLLIFDNAESPEAVRGYFPAGGPGSVMVTSRNPQWASIARTLEVDVFAREESIELLRRRGPALDDKDADRLANALGDLPLALEQAAAWRAETGMSTEEYLRLFEQKRHELLAASAPVDYQLPVAAAWNVSLDRLVVSNPAAFRLLQLCSFFAPEPIPRTLLSGAHNTDVHPELNAALRDPMRLNRAIRDINRFSLARVNHRTNSIQMHRLIQAVLVDRMSEPERRAMLESAHLLLAASDRNDPYTPANWGSYADLYPHIDQSRAYESEQPWVQQLVDNEAKSLYWSGELESALALTHGAYGARRERLGTDHPATLKIGQWLGFMLFVHGDYPQAAQHNAEILNAYQRTTAEDSEELLAALGAVAADHRAAGDYPTALEMTEDVYQRHVAALGEDDPATLNAAHNLAVSLRLMGHFKRARDIDQDTYQRRVLLLGDDHTATLESSLNQVTNRRELGEYVTALALQQDLVQRLRSTTGSEQIQTIRAERRLASALRKAGDHVAAREISADVRARFTERFGPEHPDTLLASFGLAIDLRVVGEHEEATQLTDFVHASYRRQLGEEHPYTVSAAVSGAIVHRFRGDAARAREIDEAAEEVLTRRLGPNHPLTLACRVNLGNDRYAAGEVEAAYELDTETAQRLRRWHGEQHPTTLICLGNLAMDLLALGREEEARRLHGQIVPLFQALLGEQHPATVAGTDLTQRGDCDLDPMPL